MFHDYEVQESTSFRNSDDEAREVNRGEIPVARGRQKDGYGHESETEEITAAVNHFFSVFSFCLSVLILKHLQFTYEKIIFPDDLSFLNLQFLINYISPFRSTTCDKT